MQPTVAVDVGTHSVKVGWAGEENPSVRNCRSCGVVGGVVKYGFSGVAARGAVVVEADVENLLRHCLGEIGDTTPPRMIVTQRGWVEQDEMTTTLENIFESIPSLTAVSLLRSSSATSFHVNLANILAVDVGHTQTSVLPVIDHVTLRQGVVTCSIGGKHITEDVGSLMLAKHGVKPLDRCRVDAHVSQKLFWREEAWREVKEGLIRVGDKVGDEELVVYKMPDGQVVRFAPSELQSVGDGFFKRTSEQSINDFRDATSVPVRQTPHHHHPAIPLPSLILLSSRRIDDLSCTLLLNGSLAPTGGTTLTPNFVPTLESALYNELDLHEIVIPQAKRTCVPMTDSDRLFSPWKGASLYGAWSGSATTDVTREAWLERGRSLLVDAW